jgi:hypothetical protein
MIPATAEQVASLYGVAKTTVYRWYENDLFAVPPQVLPSPSGTRDRLLFDRAAVGKQFQEEMLDPRSQRPENITRDRKQRLEEFLGG